MVDIGFQASSSVILGSAPEESLDDAVDITIDTLEVARYLTKLYLSVLNLTLAYV